MADASSTVPGSQAGLVAGEIDELADASTPQRRVDDGPVRTDRRRPFNFGRWFRATGWRHIVGIVDGRVRAVPARVRPLVVAQPARHAHRLERAVLGDRPRQLRAHPHRPAGPVPAAGSRTRSSSPASPPSARCSSARSRRTPSRACASPGRRFGLITIVVVQMFPQLLAVVAIFLLMTRDRRLVPGDRPQHPHRPDHGVPRRRARREHVPHVRLLQHDPGVDRRGGEDRRRRPRAHLLHDHPAARRADPRGRRRCCRSSSR